jgi:hypothetical protein
VNSGGRDREALRAFGLVSGIGAVFAVSIGAGLGLGLLISWLVGGGVLSVSAGLMFGAIAGGFGVYRLVMRSLG